MHLRSVNSEYQFVILSLHKETMKTKIPTIKKETLTAVGLLAILSMGCGRTAGNNEAVAEDRDSVPEVVSQMIAAIEADDSVAYLTGPARRCSGRLAPGS